MEGCPRLGYWHFSVCSRSEGLAHHDPPTEFALTPEVGITAFDGSCQPQTEERDADEVSE